MIFVDTNVWMYAVGRAHPLKAQARDLVRSWQRDGTRVATSAEVLQELLHAYVPVGRRGTLRAALHLATSLADVWPFEVDDVRLAAGLAADHDDLSARDLAHLAVCLRHEVEELATFDRRLEAAFARVG